MGILGDSDECHRALVVKKYSFDDDVIQPRSKVTFPAHHALVGACLASPLGSVEHMNHGSLSRSSFDRSLVPGSDSDKGRIKSFLSEHVGIHEDFSSEVHASLSLGLDFSPGINIAKDITRKYLSTMHSSPESGQFIMAVSFGHASFLLNDDSAGIALEAAIGEYYGDLKVSMLRDTMELQTQPSAIFHH
jgi:hypothetical protein